MYTATVFAVLYATDTSELERGYIEVVKKDAHNWDIVVVKKRPAGWVSLSEMSPIALSAIIISEDAAFWQHDGFDFVETWQAFKENLSRGKFARGGSTITQQVVKNIYLSNQKTITRKLMELVLAIRMERQVSKRKILELYLNLAELGDGIYGVRQAASRYFHKTPGALTAKEGAFLAMLLPSPVKYSVSYRKQALTPYARSTVNRILRKLHAAKRLSLEEMRAEMNVPFSFEASPAAITDSEMSDMEQPIDEEVIEEDAIQEPTIAPVENPRLNEESEPQEEDAVPDSF